MTVVTPALGLNSISTQLVRTWGYDATDADDPWKMYDPADAAGSDLSQLTQGQGYWIKSSEAATLLYGGNSYSLAEGWTLIGWLG